MRKRTLISLLLLLFALPASGEVCGKILSGTGHVELLKKGKHVDRFYTPGKTLAIDCDEVVYTGADGSALVQLGNAKFAVGPTSRLEIAGYARTDGFAIPNILNLIYGRLRAWHVKTPSKSLRIRTPTAVMGVRGTDFYVSHDNKSHITVEATLEGAVEVGHVDSEETVMITAGSQISLDKRDLVLSPKPLTEPLKEEIRDNSTAAKEDIDFQSPEAIQSIGQPKTWKIVKDLRWVTTLGVVVGELDHSNSSVNGGLHGATVVVQMHKHHGGMSLISAVSLAHLESEGDDGGGNNGGSNAQEELETLSAEGGVRLWHDHWWSPFTRLGLSLAKNSISFPNTTGPGQLKVETEYVAGLFTLGLDTIYRPGSWETNGIYGSVQGQLVRSLIGGDSSKSDPSLSADDKLAGFFVSLQLGLSF